ncbi:MAG: bifunctional DNA primase/polymerase [Syntrophobacteraceae bacterium]|jgi:RecA-family ATPase
MAENVNVNGLLKAALSYAEQKSWPVLPLHSIRNGVCTCGKRGECDNPGKHPRWHEQDLAHGAKSASTVLDLIRRWWKRWPDANIGIATGAKSFDALDVDLPEGPNTLLDLAKGNDNIPDTIEQITGSGGRQIFFGYAGGGLDNDVKFAPGLDIRTDGGLVVVPPSRHISGNRYEWEASSRPDEKQLAPMPEWLLNAIKAAKKPSGSNGSGGPLDIEKIFAGLPEGKRDEYLFKYACRLREKDLDRKEVEALILNLAKSCKPPFPQEDALKKVESAWKYQPGKAGTTSEQPEKSCFSEIALESISATRFISTEPEPIRWRLNESLPAGVFGMIVGDGGSGKGFVLLQMGISVATGLAFLDGRYQVGECGKVVLVFAEDDNPILHHRLDGTIRSFGEDAENEEFLSRLKSNLYVISLCGQDSRLVQNVGGHLLPTKAYDDFLTLLKSVEDLKLVGLDPLSRFYVGEENSTSDATYFCSLLEHLAQETGATVLASQHTNKASGIGQKSLTQHAIRGSSGFTNAARWQLNLARVDPSEWRSLGIPQSEINRYIVCRVVKKNMGPPEDCFYLKHDENGTLRRVLVKRALTDQDKEVLTDILDKIAEREQAGGKRYTKRTFGRDFSKYKQWPDYGARKLERLIDYALEEGLLCLEPGRNPQGVTVDYLSAQQG